MRRGKYRVYYYNESLTWVHDGRETTLVETHTHIICVTCLTFFPLYCFQKGPNYNEQVTINGKACKNVVVGQAVKVVANSARVKIPYNCQQGDCGTCMIKMNGRKVKACQMSIPSGKCTIQTL